MIIGSYKMRFVLIILLFLSCGSTDRKNSYEVLGIIDGDTIIINHPKVDRLRYIGIDAPEVLNNYSPGEPFQLESTNLNKKLVGGKKITVEYDQEKYGPYGRLLGYVFVDGVLVNKEIVRRGLARASFIGVNRKYEDIILKAQQEARKAKQGIWGDPGRFQAPKDNRRFLIKPKDAKRYIDKSVLVRGKVTKLIKKKDKVIVLRVNNLLNITFFKSDFDNFRFFGIDPSNFYLGKYVEVIGRIRMYRGSPQIIVEHPISIKVLD